MKINNINSYTNAQMKMNKNKDIAFKGNPAKYLKDNLYIPVTKFVGENVITPAANNIKIQKLANKLKKSPSYYLNLTVADSIVLSGFYMYNTSKNKDIKKEQKLPLIVNQGLVALLSGILTYSLDGIIEKGFKIFSNTYVKELSKKLAGTPDLDTVLGKTRAGLGKLKTLVIFGIIYRLISPVFITPVANRVSEKIQNNKAKKQAANPQVQKA